MSYTDLPRNQRDAHLENRMKIEEYELKSDQKQTKQFVKIYRESNTCSGEN